jgi:predicted  nucleic acid-binding Zn-ribbon protein
MDRAAACAVNRLKCEDCGTVYYSAAAKTLVEQGERCAKCGGKLFVDDGHGKVVANGVRPVEDEPTE